MIELLIALYLTGSIAEQQYIAVRACDVTLASGYSYLFDREADFVNHYTDDSTLTINAVTGKVTVTNSEGRIVYTEK